MAWVSLAAAGILEIVWAVAMKHSHGFTRLVFAATMVVAMIGSFGLLSISMRTLPLGTAYTIWTGIGAVGAFLIGIVFLGGRECTAHRRRNPDRRRARADEGLDRRLTSLSRGRNRRA